MTTVTPSLLTDIRRALPQLRLHENVPLREHCSFRIGGPAAALARPDSMGQLMQLCQMLRQAGVRPLLLGNGTNMLFEDAPLDLFVIKTGEGLARADVRGCTLTAGCGISLARLACLARDAGLTGLEFAHGIPGTLGGALFMNAGAYGGQMKDVCVQTCCLNDQLQMRTLSGQEQGFDYRKSVFSGGGFVILSGTLVLQPGIPAEIDARMRELMEKRRASQPLELPSAGSTFKRPHNGYAAAMIDQSGLRGYSVGAAQVSPKHAGFVVNNGGATFDEVMAVMDHVRHTVYERFGTLLEPEVRIIRRDTWNF